ncbi:hypothetical protein [Bradyrhizobium guangdongense]
MARTEAENALKSSIEAQRSLGIKGDHWENYAIARNVLQEELGQHGDRIREAYGLTQDVADVLIAHTRQDAAHALCNTKSLLDKSAKISSQLSMLNFLMLLTVCLLGAIVAKLYPFVLGGVH